MHMDPPTCTEKLKYISTSESDNSNSPLRETTSLSSCETEFVFPKCTSDWGASMVNKVGVCKIPEEILSIVNAKWCFFYLTPFDHENIDRCVGACGLKLDYESLDDIASHIVTPFKEWNAWNHPSKQELKIIRTEPLLEKFLVKLEEFNYFLAQIIACRNKNPIISEAIYQTLFEKLLQMFNLYTWSQPHLNTEKTMIMGKTVSSKADILCCLSDPAIENKIVCVCEVKNKCLEEVSEDGQNDRPWKKLRSCSKESTSDISSINSTLDSQHIGELFVHLQNSARTDCILGMTIERTLVRLTCLHVQKSTMEKIKTGNKAGSVKLEERDRPVFCYSKRYNFLKKEERRTLFKAFLLIRMMQVRFEKGTDAS